MSHLRIYTNGSANHTDHTDGEEITSILAGAGIQFERWDATHPLSKEATSEQVIDAYNESIERLKQERGFLTRDVVAIHPGTPNHPEFRKKFLNEHTHSDDEARFFVDGSGLFYINGGDALVYALLCEKGDLVNVPAGTKHWFDMGSSPFFQCIRVFKDEAGWVGNFTGSTIATEYPDFDSFLKEVR